MQIKLFALLLFAGCIQPQPAIETKTLDFETFSIEAPSTWIKLERKGVDSQMGAIAVDSVDTLHFDYGWYSNSLAEEDPVIWSARDIRLLDLKTVDTSNVIIVRDREYVDPDQYRLNNISWDTIDGRKTKIIFPRRSGIGTTGIYIEDVWESSDPPIRFNLYGVNLQPHNEQTVLRVLQTLRFHDQ